MATQSGAPGDLIGDEPFAVILPDDVIDAETPCLQQMIEAYRASAATWSPPWKWRPRTSRPMAFSTSTQAVGSTMRVRGMVEKPKRDVAPSNMAVIGRYILTPQVLRNLEDVEAGVGGEVQLTDAIAAEIATRGDVSPSASRAAASIAARSRATCRRPSPSDWRGRTCATSSWISCGPSPRASSSLPPKLAARALDGSRRQRRERSSGLLGFSVGKDRVERRRIEGRAQLGADRIAAQGA